MSDTENILNDDGFFKDTVDGPKEGIDLHKKQELLRENYHTVKDNEHMEELIKLAMK